MSVDLKNVRRSLAVRLHTARKLLVGRPPLYSIDGKAGIYRHTPHRAIADMSEDDVLARCTKTGNCRVFTRDRNLERRVTRALGKEWVPAGEWFVCDCGEFVRKIIVTDNGLTCPHCQPSRAPGRVAQGVFSLSPGEAFPLGSGPDLATDRLSTD